MFSPFVDLPSSSCLWIDLKRDKDEFFDAVENATSAVIYFISQVVEWRIFASRVILTVRRHVADEEPVLDHRLEVVDERAAEEDHHLPLVHVQQLTLDVELRVEGRAALLGPVLYRIRIAVAI